VPGDQLTATAEEWAKKLASLPQHAVRSNKLLVNRVYEVAGFMTALDYRSDPAMAAMLEQRGAALDPNLKVLREQGWEAFRRSRDAMYAGEQEARGID
jgi:enoyl-CoA hydratase/carnithine racemase